MPFRSGNIAVSGPCRRRERVRRRREVIRLAAEKNEIERLAQCLGKNDRRQWQADIAKGTANNQPAVCELTGAMLPDQESDIASGVEESAAEIAANSAGADHQNSHQELR
jgi:hypothetical protein